ncbi:hypothetical protein Dimus_013777, partial [Dionaea muscipula]
QKWENLFKRRELVHIDAVKEFYAKMTVIHLKKRDVVKSKVRGVDLEFDHEKLATILGGRSEKRKKKEIRMTLVGKRVIDEAAIEGESGSDDRSFMMLEDENRRAAVKNNKRLSDRTPSFGSAKDRDTSESTLGSY